MNFWPKSTAGSPRALTRQTSRRPERCWRYSRRRAGRVPTRNQVFVRGFLEHATGSDMAEQQTTGSDMAEPQTVCFGPYVFDARIGHGREERQGRRAELV